MNIIYNIYLLIIGNIPEIFLYYEVCELLDLSLEYK